MIVSEHSNFRSLMGAVCINFDFSREIPRQSQLDSSRLLRCDLQVFDNVRNKQQSQYRSKKGFSRFYDVGRDDSSLVLGVYFDIILDNSNKRFSISFIGRILHENKYESRI